MNRTPRPRRAATAATCLALAVSAVALAGCSSDSSTATATSAVGASDASGQVLPVTSNPIDNPSTVDALTIDSVLVENNVDADTGKAVDDHLEIAVTNTGTVDLSAFEVFYTFTDKTTGDSESYYLALPDTFTVAPGASRTIHFDNTGAADHFPVNEFGLYQTSRNELDVSVTVSATDAMPATATTTKDAGGEEEAD